MSSVAKSCPTLATPWTAAHQAPLSMGFPRQEYWSGLPFPFLGDLPNSGIKPMSPALAGRFFFFFFLTTEPPGKPLKHITTTKRPPSAKLPLLLLVTPGRRTPRPSLRRAGCYQWCGSSEKLKESQSTVNLSGRNNTSCPATYGSYRINKVDLWSTLRSLHSRIFTANPIWEIFKLQPNKSGEWNGNPLQYSCLENSMDKGAWWATVHGVTNSQTWLTTEWLTHKPSKELATLVMFMAQTGHCHPEHLDNFPQEPKHLLSYTALNVDLPITLCKALTSPRNSSIHQGCQSSFLNLTLPCKLLRLCMLILWLMRIKVQKTRIKWVCIAELHTHTLRDSSTTAAKISLEVMTKLQRKQVNWCQDHQPVLSQLYASLRSPKYESLPWHSSKGKMNKNRART